VLRRCVNNWCSVGFPVLRFRCEDWCDQLCVRFRQLPRKEHRCLPRERRSVCVALRRRWGSYGASQSSGAVTCTAAIAAVDGPAACSQKKRERSCVRTALSQMPRCEGLSNCLDPIVRSAVTLHVCCLAFCARSLSVFVVFAFARPLCCFA